MPAITVLGRATPDATDNSHSQLLTAAIFHASLVYRRFLTHPSRQFPLRTLLRPHCLPQNLLHTWLLEIRATLSTHMASQSQGWHVYQADSIVRIVFQFLHYII